MPLNYPTLHALIATLRETIAPAVDDAERLAKEDAEHAAEFGEDDPPDYGGNCDDAFEAGEMRGRAALALDVLALLDAAESDDNDGGHDMTESA